MNPLILDDDDCTLSLTLKAAGQEVTQKLDLASVSIDLGVISKKAGEDARAWLEGVAEYVQSLGFPRPSLTTARRFYFAIDQALGALKKSDGASPTPDSPDSTTPTSSSSRRAKK